MRWAGAAWALAALGLAEAGARQWPLLAGGLAPLVAVLLLAALVAPPAMPAGGSLPLAAARAAMLPMMATLPAMGAWCSAAGWSPTTMALVHAAAMLGPPLVVGRASDTVCRALLLSGGVALLLPGLQGLMLASTLHAAAAGLACAGASPVRSRGWLLAGAAAVLATGLAVDRFGPAALVALHAALALAALAPPRTAAVSASRA